MNSTIYTIRYRGTPAQLVGILWDRDKGDTGLAVIRLKSEGRFLRAVHPSELEPMQPSAATAHGTESPQPLQPPQPEAEPGASFPSPAPFVSVTGGSDGSQG